MAKTRSLPDKFYDKDYEHNGIHRVPLWRIAGYALNNTATNVYLMMMNYATYYLMGWVGVGMMVASSLTMMMRMWDGVTDPFIGFMVDKTNGKFGKNRPFIVIGQIILCVTSWVAFHVTHKLPQGVRFPFYVPPSQAQRYPETHPCCPRGPPCGSSRSHRAVPPIKLSSRHLHVPELLLQYSLCHSRSPVPFPTN